ncbi:P-loop ATPase, Sll1717 family [Azospira inquinata]|uniref:Uncharacterized protein n=1 Tax=Azospira inquinata TaxID=2785627 RepID=A0A975SK41_9RHOO|nr:hypothetical protein [Azospira inquinata]QWT46875.1 hypothetical protein J8L76_03965 [Azospira inquinata]QWT47803.1 hypothetical protein Azoinq_07905 [Azospira inquinata]
MSLNIQLDSRKLWGNEAADDESAERLNSYFVMQPVFESFFDPDERFLVARARKGLGKSALLRECAFRADLVESNLVISVKGGDLVAQKKVETLSPTEHIHDWQQRICAVINRALGSQIGAAFSDDKMALVEAAELAGLKNRNLVGGLLERVKGKLGLQSTQIKDDKALLSRVIENEEKTVWLILDDIDATFEGGRDEIRRLSTFFSACRELAANFKGVVIRASIRSDVWTTIERTDEALDKADQYVRDIRWSRAETKKILAERVSSYLRLEKRMPESDVAKFSDTKLCMLVFKNTFPDQIHVWSVGRPRWAAQLGRMAGAVAVRTKSNKITDGHIRDILFDYGKYRLNDIAREHKLQCGQIEMIANSFSKGQAALPTEDLLTHIRTKVIPNMQISIEGRDKPSDIEIARFLFKIGFIVGHQPSATATAQEYFSFDQKPDLLVNEANLDDGLIWRIQAAYHSVLRLRDNRNNSLPAHEAELLS